MKLACICQLGCCPGLYGRGLLHLLMRARPGQVRLIDLPPTLLERPHGWIIQASSNRVFEVVKNDGAGDLLDTEPINLHSTFILIHYVAFRLPV